MYLDVACQTLSWREVVNRTPLKSKTLSEILRMSSHGECPWSMHMLQYGVHCETVLVLLHSDDFDTFTPICLNAVSIVA